jgi:hypothetical protein
VLQSVVRKPPPAPAGSAAPPGGTGSTGSASTPPVQLPAGRISWREIANWSHLHAQAVE